MSLSIYRIQRTPTHRAIFITLATINSIYCSIWDLAMDWSLCNPYAKHPFLRDMLGYKSAWYYYIAMTIDPVLRFNWIFYAIFSHDFQHSAILSFLVSFSEIIRRGMWSLFRVENEHCTNVGRFRALRDIPLPYDLVSSPQSNVDHPVSPQRTKDSQQPSVPDLITSEGMGSHTTATDIESAPAAVGTSPQRSPLSLRLRRTRSKPGTETAVVRGISRVGSIMAAAHAQDFERKKRTDIAGLESPHFGGRESVSSDEDGDEDDSHDEDNEEDVVRAAAEEQELMSPGPVARRASEGNGQGSVRRSPRGT
jgi:xenotropic and polytropic retrovirus receptor 1